MKHERIHKKNLLACMWINMIGKLDAYLVRWGVKPQREKITCQEFSTLMQDVMDHELNNKEFQLFQQQQKKCQGCAEKFVEEQEALSLIKSKLKHSKQAPSEDFKTAVRNQVLLY